MSPPGSSALPGAGTTHAINLLRTELRADLGMIGALTLNDLDPRVLDLSQFREISPNGALSSLC